VKKHLREDRRENENIEDGVEREPTERKDDRERERTFENECKWVSQPLYISLKPVRPNIQTSSRPYLYYWVDPSADPNPFSEPTRFGCL
jgi:hypothetical protein